MAQDGRFIFVDTTDSAAREAYIVDSPHLPTDPVSEQPRAMPPIENLPQLADLLPRFDREPPPRMTPVGVITQQQAHDIVRLSTTEQQRRLIQQILNADPTTKIRIIAARAHVSEGCAYYWRRQHVAGVDIVRGSRAKSGRKKRGPVYCQVLMDSLTVSKLTLRETARKLREERTADPSLPPSPSKSAIQRYVTSHAFEDDGGVMLSWKILSVRGRTSNTPENKEKRVRRLQKLSQRLAEGFLWVSVDETRVEVISTNAKRGWGPVNDRSFIYSMRHGLTLSIITAISPNRIEYTVAIHGSNTAETFVAYVDRLLESLPTNEKAVLWMDNASIHNSIKDHLVGTRHCCLKNAPYTPDLNPIEIFFGVFKRRLSSINRIPENLEDLLTMVAATIRDTPQSFVRSEIEHVRTKVWTDVLERKDL